MKYPTSSYCIVLSILFFIFSCTGKIKDNTPVINIDSIPSSQTIHTDSTVYERWDQDTTVIAMVTASHVFSDTIRKDFFSLTLRGHSIISGRFIFRIFDADHTLIHDEKFDAADLLYDMKEVISSVKAKEDTILSHMKLFFSEPNFLKPAFDPNGSDPDPDLPEYWEEIKADPSATGFFYSYGYESMYGIAYSKKAHKVVTCFYSD